MSRHPKLEEMLKNGHIQVDGDAYVGIAFDGPVQLGNIGNEDNLENYLTEYPTRSDW